MDTPAIKKARYNSLLFEGALGILGIILIGCTNYFGFWWCTILLGIIVGIIVQHSGAACLLSLLMGGLGWGGGLLYQAFFLPVTRTATLIAEIIGIGRDGEWIVISVTILLGVLLCISGTWFGLALKSLMRILFFKRDYVRP